MPIISFFIQDISFNLINKTKVRIWLTVSAGKEGFSIAEINYIFCSDKFLHDINKQYLHHDELTDIITFDLSDISIKYQVSRQITADIFISIERVKENAKLFKTTFQNELLRVMIHGVLHLCGYKDKTKKQQEAIRKKENFYLAKI